MLSPDPRGCVQPSGQPHSLSEVADHRPADQCRWALSLRRISPYESRSSGYRSHTGFRHSAPSSRNLTGKLFRSCSIEPFMVELFTVGRLTRSPDESCPVFFVAKEQLPTPAALSELACASPNPTDGIFTRFDLRLIQQPKAKQDRCLVSSTRPCPKARDVRIARIQTERSRQTTGPVKTIG